MAKYPSCEIGAYYAIMRSARILDDLERIGVPGVVGAYAHPAAASGWGIVVVSMQQQYAGHAAQVLALTAQCPAAAYYTKWIIAVDDDVDPTDFNEVMWALSTRCHPSEDIDILKKTWSTGLDPSQFEMERRPYGSKALIDACKPHRHLKSFPATTLLRREVYERVAARWASWAFPTRRRGSRRFTKTETARFRKRLRHTRLSRPQFGEGKLQHCLATQFSLNSPSIAFSSAGLISRECATSTECSGPSSFSTQNARKRCNSGNFGNRS